MRFRIILVCSLLVSAFGFSQTIEGYTDVKLGVCDLVVPNSMKEITYLENSRSKLLYKGQVLHENGVAPDFLYFVKQTLNKDLPKEVDSLDFKSSYPSSLKSSFPGATIKEIISNDSVCFIEIIMQSTPIFMKIYRTKNGIINQGVFHVGEGKVGIKPDEILFNGLKINE